MTPVTVALLALGALIGVAVLVTVLAHTAKWADGLDDETDSLARMGKALR